MEKLFEEAEAKGLWLYCSYQDLWFSPQELHAANEAGRFRWGAMNWTLRNPDEMVEAARQKVLAATREFDRQVVRVGMWRRMMVTK